MRPADGEEWEMTTRSRFQSPPPRRGACDGALGAWCGPTRRARFNPLRRGGGRATSCSPCATGWWTCTRFNPLRRGGGRATTLRALWQGSAKPTAFQSPPPRRGACDRADNANRPRDHLCSVSIPSAEAGGVRRCRSERTRLLFRNSRFNPLRRGGGRATAPSPCCWATCRRPGFNPLRRGGGRATVPCGSAPARVRG